MKKIAFLILLLRKKSRDVDGVRKNFPFFICCKEKNLVMLFAYLKTCFSYFVVNNKSCVVDGVGKKFAFLILLLRKNKMRENRTCKMYVVSLAFLVVIAFI